MTISYFQTANKLKQEGKLEEAIACYHSVIEQNPKFYWPYHNLGETLDLLGRTDEAIKAYNQAIDQNPNSAFSHHNLGDVLVKLGQLDDAIIAYRRAVEICPNVDNFYNSLGQTFYELALQITPDSLELYQRLGEVLPKLAQSEGYLTELDNLNAPEFIQVTSHLNNEDFIEKLYCVYLKRQPDEAGKKHFIEDIRNNLTRQEIVYKIRQSHESISLPIITIRATEPYYIKDEDFLQATDQLNEEAFVEELYRAYLKRNADDEGKNHYIQHLCNGLSRKELVEGFRQAPEFKSLLKFSIVSFCVQEAIVAYRRSIELNPNNHKSEYNLREAINYQGKLLAQAGKLEAAIESYKQVIAAVELNLSDYPNLAEAHYHQGNALRQQGKFEEALESYKQAIGINPNYTEAYLGRAAALTLLDKFDESVSDWRNGLELCADIQQALFDVGDRVTFDRGKMDAAIKLYQLVYEVQHKRADNEGYQKLNITFLSPHWVSRIGHLACLDYYVKMGILGWRSLHLNIILAPHEVIANSCLLNYWQRYHIYAISDPLLIERLSPITKNLQEHFNVWSLSQGEVMGIHEARTLSQKQWEAEGRSPLLTLSDRDRERGWSCLRQLGVPTDAWFVCLHVREPGYWQDSAAYLRNSNVDTYLLAVKTIVEHGGWVIRMGNPTMKPLPQMNKVIDYAHSDARSDWMDVFLCASSRFIIGTDSGLTYVPSCFGVPIAMTNNVPMGVRMYSQQDIYISKLYWSIHEERYLDFAQSMAPPLGHAFSNEGLAASGVKVVDNTPDEINDLVVEMLERIDGTIKYTPDDERLQANFNRLAEALNAYGCSRIGRNFLRKYAWLLPASDDYKTLGKVSSDSSKIKAISSLPKGPYSQ